MTPSHRRFPPSLIITTWLLALASPAALAACSVTTAPEGWAANSLRWDGDCVNGLANGLGVLKEQQGATVQRSFFGRVDKGELALGVIDTPEQGFSAGHFAQGRVQPSDERQARISTPSRSPPRRPAAPLPALNRPVTRRRRSSIARKNKSSTNNWTDLDRRVRRAHRVDRRCLRCAWRTLRKPQPCATRLRPWRLAS